MTYSAYYPEGLSGRDICYMEGCVGKGPCPRCGEVNYRLMGYYGALARWAKEWGISEDEAARRIENNQRCQDGYPSVEEEEAALEEALTK